MRIQIFWKPFVPCQTQLMLSLYQSPKNSVDMYMCTSLHPNKKFWLKRHILLCVCRCIFQQRVTAIILLFPDMYGCRAFKEKMIGLRVHHDIYLMGIQIFLNTIVPWHMYCSTNPKQVGTSLLQNKKKIIISQRVFQNNDIQIFRNLEIRINKDYV